MPTSRHFKACPDKYLCKLVGKGECDGHPYCRDGSKCRYLKTRSCAFYHPRRHFEDRYRHRSSSSRRSPRSIRHHSEERRSSKKSRKRKKHKNRNHDRERIETKDGSWTQWEHNKLIEMTKNYKHVDDIPIRKLNEIKSTLHKDLSAIKLYITQLKTPKHTTALRKDSRSWEPWEETYLTSYIQQQCILNTFSEAQANEIKELLNRDLDEIYSHLNRLKQEQKTNNEAIKTESNHNINGNDASQNRCASPLFQYLQKSKKSLASNEEPIAMNAQEDIVNNDNLSNIPALQHMEPRGDNAHNHNNDTVAIKVEQGAHIDNVQHDGGEHEACAQGTNVAEHEIKEEKKDNELVTNETMERNDDDSAALHNNDNDIPPLIAGDHEEEDIDNTMNSNTNDNALAMKKNERKRKYSDMIAGDEYDGNGMKNERELEILSLSLCLKKELKKSLHLLSSIRVPKEENYQHNYINLLQTQIQRIKQCNFEMHEYQAMNSRATLGDIIRARNSRGHIRKKQQRII